MVSHLNISEQLKQVDIDEKQLFCSQGGGMVK